MRGIPPRPASGGRDLPAPVWGRDDLTCPLTARQVWRLVEHAKGHPWRGDTPLTCRGHFVATTSILEPGRPTRLIFSLDYAYHQSGWFANHQYERCFHLSVSHPRPDRVRVYRNDIGGDPRPRAGIDVEAPTEDEVRAWGRVLYGEHERIAWWEPPTGPLDPHRAPGVGHLRLYLDAAWQPILPAGEPYTISPAPDGSSPARVTEGRLGADVR